MKATPTSLKEAQALLGNRESLKLGNNTYLQRRGSIAAIKLHNTDIVEYKSTCVRFFMRGWNTVVTRARMNEISRPMGWSIFTEKGIPYVGHRNGEGFLKLPFKDGVSLYPNGAITGAGKPTEEKKDIALRKKIRDYASTFVERFKAGKIPAPGPGDCLFCQMRNVADGKPFTQADHILSHIKEGYYVPSMLANANDRAAFPLASVSQVMTWTLASRWHPDPIERAKYKTDYPFVFSGLRKNLVKWIEFNLRPR